MLSPPSLTFSSKIRMNDVQMQEVKKQVDVLVQPAMLAPMNKEAVLVVRLNLLRDFVVFYEKKSQDKFLGLPDITNFFGDRGTAMFFFLFKWRVLR